MALWTKKNLTRIFPAKLEKVPPFVLLILHFNISYNVPFIPDLADILFGWMFQSFTDWNSLIGECNKQGWLIYFLFVRNDMKMISEYQLLFYQRSFLSPIIFCFSESSIHPPLMTPHLFTVSAATTADLLNKAHAQQLKTSNRERKNCPTFE